MSEAPLLSIPDDPVPEGGRGFWYKGGGGARLRAAVFPTQGARGTVILSPGRTEPMDKYWEAVRRLRAQGFAVALHDWRGQGLSEPRQVDPLLGHAARAADYAGDYRRLLDALEGEAPKPWIALAHSMGGMGVLLSLANGEKRLAGGVFSAPLLGLYQPPHPPWQMRALAFAMGLAGRAAQPLPVRDVQPRLDTFDANPLTHDRARYERWARLMAAHPQLAVGRPTFGWLGAALSAFAKINRASGEGLPPLLLIGAAEDRVVDTAAIRRLAERWPSASYAEVPGARHELMFETDAIAAPFWAQVEAFLAKF